MIGVWSARQPAQGADDRRRRTTSSRSRARGSRSRGWATRCSTRSSSRSARRTAGTRRQPGRRQRSSPTYVAAPRARPAAAGALPGRVPEPGRAQEAARRPRGDPADRASRAGIVPGFQNYTGKTLADMLRLNVAIPPTTSSPNPLGAARRRRSPASRTAGACSTTSSAIELRAIAGVDLSRSSTRATSPTPRSGWSRRTSTPGRTATCRASPTSAHPTTATTRRRRDPHGPDRFERSNRSGPPDESRRPDPHGGQGAAGKERANGTPEQALVHEDRRRGHRRSGSRRRAADRAGRGRRGGSRAHPSHRRRARGAARRVRPRCRSAAR